MVVESVEAKSHMVSQGLRKKKLKLLLTEGRSYEPLTYFYSLDLRSSLKKPMFLCGCVILRASF